ncbi:MAG: DUF58 domain-containing protein [Chloroflexota bacterium]
MWFSKRAEAEGAPGLPPPARAETPANVLRRLEWTVLRPLASYLGGDERSLLRGPGLELAEVRAYQPGDDVRHIDWNITARSGEAYVREAYTERALDVWLVLDVSASVDWGTALCLKRDRATEFVATAGQLLGRHGNRLGALLFAERPLGFVPPAGGRNHLLQLLATIDAEQRQHGRGVTDLAAALARVEGVARRKSLLLVVSDFLVRDGWQIPLGRLARRHEVVAVRLRDPRDGELPDVGIVALEDPETGKQLTVDTGDRGLRERFRQASLAQSEQLSAELLRSGADHFDLSTDAEFLPAMVAFLRARRQRRRLRARAGAAGAPPAAAFDAARVAQGGRA